MTEGIDDRSKPRLIGTVGGTVDETRATLVLRGEKLDPDEVSQELNCAPTSSHRKGDRKGPRSSPFPSGGWSFQVHVKAPAGPDEAIQQLLLRFPSDPSWWERLRSKYSVELWIGIFINAWNRGFEISPAAISTVRDTGASMQWDLYADSPNEPPDSGVETCCPTGR